MTDDDTDARTERALRDALARRAGAHEPVTLDPVAAARSARRRSRWVAVAAAAAVLVVATGTTILAATTRTGGDGTADRPAAAGTTTAATGFDGPTRQVSWRGVAVDVPADWPDESAPGGDWCASDVARASSFPTEPYVARDRTYAVTLTIGCIEDDPAPAAFGDAPERFWASHLTFGRAADSAPDGARTYRGWTLTTRTLGGVTVSLLTDATTADLVDPILDSARSVDTDANGCDSTSPVQAVDFVRPRPAFDVTGIDEVDAISVCQYDRSAGTSAPGLLGSRLISGEAAQGVLEAIRTAPPGGGPDAPQHCVHDMYGDTALAVRLHSGETTRDLYVYYEWCFGNGFDDGTTRRELTRDACLPLWGGRVTLSSGSTEPFSRCHE